MWACSTGTTIPYEKALTATFLEGLVFLGICFTGMRSRLLRLFPKTVLMAGACGIGAAAPVALDTDLAALYCTLLVL